MKTNGKDTENKVLTYCLKNKMFSVGDRVVLGVSGGADSICLLFVLLELRAQLGIELCVVHVNHGVRPDAGEDAAYVRSLCEKYELGYLEESCCLEQVAGDLGVGQEEAGRMVRYEAFEKACKKYSCNKIAVAHNQNDRAETMLFHLFRGTGLKGMSGILPVRDHVVRPLLCLEREEIERYLGLKNILYKKDSTNDEDVYTRNRIRHHILPYAQEQIAPGVLGNMCRAADIFAEEEEYLHWQTLQAKASCVLKEEAGLYTEVDVSGVLALHSVMRKRLILFLLKDLSPGQKDITTGHIEDVLSLFTTMGNRQIHLPYRICAERSYNIVRVERKKEDQSLEGQISERQWNEIQLPYLERTGDSHQVTLPNGDRLYFSLEEDRAKIPKNQLFSENRYTKWFDYDKMVAAVSIRRRKSGDYLSIHAEGTIKHKKLKDYMVAEKIPKAVRDEIPVLADGEHIIWLIGYRISEYYKINESTKRILRVQFVQGEERQWQNV